MRDKAQRRLEEENVLREQRNSEQAQRHRNEEFIRRYTEYERYLELTRDWGDKERSAEEEKTQGKSMKCFNCQRWGHQADIYLIVCLKKQMEMLSNGETSDQLTASEKYAGRQNQECVSQGYFFALIRILVNFN